MLGKKLNKNFSRDGKNEIVSLLFLQAFKYARGYDLLMGQSHSKCKGKAHKKVETMCLSGAVPLSRVLLGAGLTAQTNPAIEDSEQIF